jgi:hypothetical protein
METKQRWAGCTRRVNPLPFVTAIVASNPGDFGQGRVRCSNTGASRYDSIQKGALEHDFMPLAQVALSITDQNEHVNTQKVATNTDSS